MAAFKRYRTASGRSIAATLEKYGERAERALERQLYAEAQGIIAQSQPLVPVDTSALRSSSYVQDPMREGSLVTVNFGYGGPAAQINPKTKESTDAYALFVHENLEAFHPVGTAKFLEMPFNQAKAGMGARIARNMKTDLGGGGSGISEAPEE